MASQFGHDDAIAAVAAAHARAQRETLRAYLERERDRVRDAGGILTVPQIEQWIAWLNGLNGAA